MLAPVVCSLCGRRGGKPAEGAAINSLGCTGACLLWAVRVIKNPPLFDDELDWGPGMVSDLQTWHLFERFVQMSMNWAMGTCTGIL